MIRNKKGFTLIELMIVMAIIGILAVVALVAISGKSADARDARRLSDANSIRLAFSIHAVDHGSDYLESVDGYDEVILLHELANRSDVAYLISLDGVKDPIASRDLPCYSYIGGRRCDTNGGYTIFDLIQFGDGDEHMGTFDNYAIGIKLESYVSQKEASLDWRKYVGIPTAYAVMLPPPESICGNSICEPGEDYLNCPADCEEVVVWEPDFSENDWLFIGPEGVQRLTHETDIDAYINFGPH